MIARQAEIFSQLGAMIPPMRDLGFKRLLAITCTLESPDSPTWLCVPNAESPATPRSIHHETQARLPLS